MLRSHSFVSVVIADTSNWIIGNLNALFMMIMPIRADRHAVGIVTAQVVRKVSSAVSVDTAVIPAARNRDIGHATVHVTSHCSQGQTADRGIAVVEMRVILDVE